MGRVEMKSCDVLRKMYGLPDHKVREFVHKQSLVEAAELLLSHTDDSILIVSRGSNGQPSVLESNGAGGLIDFLDFEYED